MLTISPILIALSCFLSIAWADSGCNDAMLKMRIESEDLPKLIWYSGQAPEFTITQHCRAHSFTNPVWLSSTLIALRFASSNSNDSIPYFSLLHYNSCNETTSRFNDPIILINTTVYDSSLHMQYVTNNTDADFCYSCVNNSTMNFCQSCDPSCDTTDGLNYCYGPSETDCCNYVQGDDCVLMCTNNYYPDVMSTCVYQHICEYDSPCINGDCTANGTKYVCNCPDTHLGKNCSIPNPCNIAGKCNNNGNCTVLDTSPYFKCNCIMGVEGSNCEINKFCNVSTNPCLNDGNCTSIQADNYECTCRTGYTGNDCQTSPSTTTSPVVAIAASVVAVVIVITALVIIVVIVCVVIFYLKRKKGKVDIARKTSKVYPSNGNGTVDEKAPILEEEKTPILDKEKQ